MKRNAQRMKEGQNKIRKTTKTSLLEPPVKSKSDKKEYRLICLKNGLQALLINHESDENISLDEIHEETGTTQETSNDSDDETDSQSSSDEQDREKLAAVALAINTGSFNDPCEVQGLAHFVGKQ